MANSLTSNPWRLDTANTTTVLTTLRTRINRIHWTTPTAGDVLILKDKAGVTKVSYRADSTADVDVYNVADCAGEEWDGLIGYQIPHGVVEITYK